jgi:hypothetical protein
LLGHADALPILFYPPVATWRTGGLITVSFIDPGKNVIRIKRGSPENVPGFFIGRKAGPLTEKTQLGRLPRQIQ